MIQSIKKNEHFGVYKLGTHDCQDWVKKVTADYLAIKAKGHGVEMQTPQEMGADKMADANVKSQNAALASTHSAVYNSIGNDRL